MGKDETKVGILGNGEVGQAIAKFYSNPKIKDLKRDDGLKGSEILHVCIPWSSRFIDTVASTIKEIRPQVTIIHSSVVPGTTVKLAGKFKGMVVHSPIRGLHPKLHEGIKVFVKYIGAENKKAGNLAQRHLRDLGIKTKIFYPAATTELGKLLDTTYYGVVIAWHGDMEKMCNKFHVDFKQAVTDFNLTYNQGYKKLGRTNVMRPVLYPPKNKIGGHCVIPNAEILKKYFKSKAIDSLLDYQ